MRHLIAIAFGLTLCTSAFAQDVEAVYTDGCGNVVGSEVIVPTNQRQERMIESAVFQTTLANEALAECMTEPCSDAQGGAKAHLVGACNALTHLLPLLKLTQNDRIVMAYRTVTLICEGGNTPRPRDCNGDGLPDDQANESAINRLGCIDHAPDTTSDAYGDQPADYCTEL